MRRFTGEAEAQELAFAAWVAHVNQVRPRELPPIRPAPRYRFFFDQGMTPEQYVAERVERADPERLSCIQPMHYRYQRQAPTGVRMLDDRTLAIPTVWALDTGGEGYDPADPRASSSRCVVNQTQAPFWYGLYRSLRAFYPDVPIELSPELASRLRALEAEPDETPAAH